MASENEIIQFLADLQTFYEYEHRDPGSLIRVWSRALARVPAEILPAVYDQVTARRKWFPKMPEVLEDVKFVQGNNGHSMVEPEPTVHEAYWRAMDFFNSTVLHAPDDRILRDRRIAGFVGRGVATEWDDLSPAELERIADERSGYKA